MEGSVTQADLRTTCRERGDAGTLVGEEHLVQAGQGQLRGGAVGQGDDHVCRTEGNFADFAYVKAVLATIGLGHVLVGIVIGHYCR